MLPHAALTVWQGHLLIASHIDFLLKVVAPPSKPDPLKDDVDYLLVNEEIKKFEPKEKCRPGVLADRRGVSADLRADPPEQDARERGHAGASCSTPCLAKARRAPPRTQKIDGSQLPDYQVVRRYLGPAGFKATSEPNGWYLKGFTLTK